MFGTTGANLRAAADLAAPGRIVGGPVVATAFIARERNFRKLTAPFKVGPPKMPGPMVFPAIEIG
jgi:hypothetical protein